MPTAEKARRRARETLWNQRFTLVLLILFAGYQVFFVNPRTDEIHAGICAQKQNLQEQIANTQTFLKDPSQFPAFDDPKTLALIRTQMENQTRALDAYSVVDC